MKAKIFITTPRSNVIKNITSVLSKLALRVRGAWRGDSLSDAEENLRFNFKFVRIWRHLHTLSPNSALHSYPT
jgi:hypothetical protein